MKWSFKTKKAIIEENNILLKYSDKLKGQLVQTEISRDNVKREKEYLEKRTANLEAYNQLILGINDELKLQKDELYHDLKEQEKLIKELQGSKGGYKSSNNKLKKEKIECENIIKKLKEEINDLRSTRYLVRKIPSGRLPKTQKIKVRSKITPKIANYQKNVMNELESEEVK